MPHHSMNTIAISMLLVLAWVPLSLAQTISPTAQKYESLEVHCTTSDCASETEIITDALLMEKRGDIEEAINILQRFKNKNPNARSSIKELARLYLSIGAHEKSIEYLLMAKHYLPKDKDIPQWLGQAYFKQRKFHEAITIFNTIQNIEEATTSTLLDYSAALDMDHQCKKAFDIAMIAHDTRHLNITTDLPIRIRKLHTNCLEQSDNALTKLLNQAKQANSVAHKNSIMVIHQPHKDTKPNIIVTPVQ